MVRDAAYNVENPAATAAWRFPRKSYLTLYNVIFAVLWLSVFITTLSHALKSKITLFTATEPRTRWIQTATLIEVLHAATGIFSKAYVSIHELTSLGIIRSPVSTTALQVVTRVIQVWMVWYSFPSSTASSHAYLALLLAWSTADTIRYAYLALNVHNKAPKWLVWLRYIATSIEWGHTDRHRYTMFYALYPIGIGAECWLLYRAIAPGREISAAIPPIFYFCLMLYIPGKYAARCMSCGGANRNVQARTRCTRT